MGSSLVNPLSMSVSYESVYSASRSFTITDFVSLQLLGLVTTKNNLMVALL